MDHDHHIGIIVPHEPELELEIYDVLPFLKKICSENITVQTVFIPGEQSLEVSQVEKTNADPDTLYEAAKNLAAGGADIISYACTSGSFAAGFENAHRQVDNLSKRTGCNITSTSLDMVLALQSLRMLKVYVLSAYPQSLTSAFEAFLCDAGFEILGTTRVDLESGRRAFDVNWPNEFQKISELRITEKFAVVLPHTTIDSLEKVALWERIHSLVIVTANVATVWNTLQASSTPVELEGFGHLFCSKMPDRT